MRKRTAVLGAFLSLLPLGQLVVIGTGAALTSSAVLLSVPEKAQAESVDFYITRGMEKKKSQDYYGAISDFNKALDFDSKNLYALEQRAFSKIHINDYIGAIIDCDKAIKFNASHKDVQNGALFGTRGWAKYLLGNRYDACSDWREAIRRGTTIATGWLRGKCD